MPIAPNDKIARAATYMSTDMYNVVQEHAWAQKLTVSALLRKVLLEELVRKGRLNQDDILRLAA